MLDTVVPTQTVVVRNLTKTRLVLSGDTKGASIEWGEAGSADGSDIQEIPVHVWASAHMRKAKAKGLVAEDNLENLDRAFTAQRADLARRAAERQAEVNNALRAGQGGAPIVISEDALNEHIDRTAKSQPSTALDEATEAADAAREAAEAAAAAAEAEVQAVLNSTTTNPMAALDAAVS